MMSSDRPRIALDARLTRQMSVGMKTYVRELANRLAYVAPHYDFVRFSEGKNFGWSEQVILPQSIHHAKIDLTHYLAHYLPWFAPKPYIVTIHDLIHLRFPEFYKSKVGPYYRTAVRRACANAACVITDDERTVADLERFLDVDPQKVRVIPLGVGAPFLGQHNGAALESTEPNAGKKYFLYVGNHRTHKDLVTFFNAWSSLPERLSIDIYLTGPDDFEGELQRRAELPENRAAGRRIVALGDVNDDELVGWYRNATALVHPALCEGFGLPLLEAMACGCPVVASTDSVPGVLTAASLVFPTQNVSALREQLEQVIVDEGLRERLVNDGYNVARTLTWDQCARATAGVYREVLGG